MFMTASRLLFPQKAPSYMFDRVLNTPLQFHCTGSWLPVALLTESNLITQCKERFCRPEYIATREPSGE